MPRPPAVFRPNRWTLWFKLSLAVFVLAVVPLLAVAVINDGEVVAQSTERETEGLQKRALAAAHRVEERVGRLRAYAELLSTNPAIQAAMSKDPGDTPRTPATAQRWDAAHPEINELLVSIRRANPWFLNVYLLRHDGLCVASSERDTKPDMLGRIYDYRPYFRAAVAGRQPFVTDVLKNANSPGTAVFVAAPIVVGEVVRAVAVIKVDTDAIYEVLGEISAVGGRALLVDRFGVIVGDADAGQEQPVGTVASLQFRALASVHSDLRLFKETKRYGDPAGGHHLARVTDDLDQQELWRTLRRHQSGAREQPFPGGGGVVPSVVGFAPVWTEADEPYGHLVLVEDAAAFRRPLEAISHVIRLRLILVAAGVALAMAVVTRRLARRVARLAEATDKVADGELQLRLDTEPRDELGALAHGFNKMTAKLAERAATEERPENRG